MSMCVFKAASCLLSSVCTPVGLSRMFTVVGQLLVKPTVSTITLYVCVYAFVKHPLSFSLTPCSSLSLSVKILEDLDEQIYCIQLQEEALERRLNGECFCFYMMGKCKVYCIFVLFSVLPE